MKIRHAVVVVAAIAALSACKKGDGEHGANGGKAATGRVVAVGSSTIAPLMPPLVDAFHKTNPGIDVSVEISTSNTGIGSLRQGMNDIALSTRAPVEGEGEIVAHVIGRDGLCMIVNKENPVEALSDEQIKGIFQGTIKNWKEVGGNDLAITRLNHAEVRNTLVLFVNYLGIQASDVKYTESVISADLDGVNIVDDKPEAVTFLSIASALNGVAEGKKLKLIGFKGVAPTVANVENGTVPVVYDLNIVSKKTPNAQTQAFIDFAKSKAADEIRTAKNFAQPKR